MQVFTAQECQEIVCEFDRVEDKRDENTESFYKGSVGVGDLSTTHKHVDRITADIRKKFPGAVFSNTYTREYRKGSILGVHTDRVGLDLTLSVCLEKKTPVAWPLYVSKTLYPHSQWDIDTDPAPYQRDFVAYDMSEGVGAICEGRKYPHWRAPFECADDERAVFVFYHWTLPKEISIPKFVPTITLSNPKAAVYEKFLSEAECALLVWMARDKLQRSTVVDNSNGGAYVDDNRTSSGMSFTVGENAVIQHIEAKISALTGYPIENGEGIQVLRYQPGQQYKPHYDYFDPSSPGVSAQLDNNRVCTFLMYLNTPENGGATVFPDAGVSVAARQGNALMFEYSTPTPDTKTLHGGAPVLKGEKWIATKWIRRNKY